MTDEQKKYGLVRDMFPTSQLAIELRTGRQPAQLGAAVSNKLWALSHGDAAHTRRAMTAILAANLPLLKTHRTGAFLAAKAKSNVRQDRVASLLKKIGAQTKDIVEEDVIVNGDQAQRAADELTHMLEVYFKGTGETGKLWMKNLHSQTSHELGN
eukprot:gene7115-4921_t